MKSNKLVILLVFLVTAGTVFPGGAKESTQETNARRIEIETAGSAGGTGQDAGPVSLAEDESVVLDAEEAVAIAMAHNLSIASEQISLRIKNRTKNTVYSYFYPTITASATLSRLHEEPGTYSQLVPVPADELDEYGMYDYMAENPAYPLGPAYVPITSDLIPEGIYGNVTLIEEEIPHTWNVSAMINMNLNLSAALYFGIKATVLDYEAGLLNIESTKRKLERDVRKQFYNLLLMKENMSLLEDNIRAAEDRYKQAETNYYNGLVSEYTMLSAQVAYENMKPSLESLKTGYESALLGFRMQLGLPLDADIELEGSISKPVISVELKELLASGIPRRLDIQGILQQMEMLENAKNLTIAGMTPAVSFMLSFDPAFTGDPFEDPWFEDEDSWMQRSGMFGVTVSVALDQLLPNSQSWVDIKNTEDNLAIARVGLRQALEAAELEIRNTVMNLNKSQKLIESLKLNVDLARRAYEMADEAYQAGGRELLEVQNAELELKKAQLEVLKEEFNYTTALLDLEYAVNASLDEIQGKNHE